MNSSLPSDMSLDLTGRSPAITGLLTCMDYRHLPDDLRGPAESCYALALHLVASLPDGPELTMALRKLLEAKDCAVRARLAQISARPTGGPGWHIDHHGQHRGAPAPAPYPTTPYRPEGSGGALPNAGGM